MDTVANAGALLRIYRLKKNWSLETLCSEICTASYLSKIEQGKVQPNQALLKDLFSKMEVPWQTFPMEEGKELCEEIYELVFSDDEQAIQKCLKSGQLNHESAELGASFLDYLVLTAYCRREPETLPKQMRPLLDARQSALMHLAEGSTWEAVRLYPCALTCLYAGAGAYADGKYTSALEYLGRSYDLAAQSGYARIMMNCQVFISNCYSDLGSMDDMLRHCRIADRLARSLGETEILRSLEYNIAATRMEKGDYSSSYSYFSRIANPTVMDLHKLAICCEMLEKRQEAFAAVNAAEQAAEGLEREMCALVRYRLEHPEYLQDTAYGKMLMDTFLSLKQQRSLGYARFHLYWVEQWCCANRQYRMVYEIVKDFL